MIPPKAKIVFKGIYFDVYHWNERMFDGSIGTFEGIRRRPSVQLIVVYEGKIMLLKEEQPFAGKFLSLCGGAVDENEKPLAAAKRELLEETGLKASKIILHRKTELFKRIEWDTYYYIMKDCKKIGETHLDSGEKITPKLVGFSEFIELVGREDFRNKEFSNYIYRLKHDKKKLEDFRKLLLE